MGSLSEPHAAAQWLLSAAAVRKRAHALLALAERGESRHFRYEAAQLPVVARYVVETIRANYPSLRVPFHSRWRHFGVGDRDRWGMHAASLSVVDAAERARARFDLAVTSVLLDAGAGPRWRYVETGGGEYRRSEGLAVASFDLFAAGVFSADPAQPYRCDAAALAQLDADTLARGMQVRSDNPLTGLEGRATLLRRLGETIASDPTRFGPIGRVGHLYDHLADRALNGTLPATEILAAILHGLGPIWPGRYTLGGIALGDVWHHTAAANDDASNGFVPLHKLSQWLSYSLIEPLEESGITVTDIDALTGLAEYRNGGLMLDAGLLVPCDQTLHERVLSVGDEVVVEWRALTVALLDRIAMLVRRELGLDAKVLPLCSVLEGGTWAAGRRIAKEKRADGGPPLRIESDGTVF